MIPNIVFAMKCKDGFENKWENKAVEIIEQIGRFGCFTFMIFNIPNTYFGCRLLCGVFCRRYIRIYQLAENEDKAECKSCGITAIIGDF